MSGVKRVQCLFHCDITAQGHTINRHLREENKKYINQIYKNKYCYRTTKYSNNFQGHVEIMVLCQIKCKLR